MRKESKVTDVPTVQQIRLIEKYLIAYRKMMKEEIEVVVTRSVQQVIGPTVGDVIRKVVKEEIQTAQEKFLTGGNRVNEMSMPKERSLYLKFLDEVSLPVLTGKPIKGKEDTPMRVALFDKMTEHVVHRGPESSGKVEILVLEASGGDNDNNWTLEEFNNRIIREGEKKKPHFAKRMCIYLKDGIGILDNVKLGHDADWMKNCKCRLGARMENFTGNKVQEAWTESFMVSDNRGKLYEKHDTPSLSDYVWRLKHIGKDGAPRKRLNDENIFTVGDFLFFHSFKPQRLQKLVGAHFKTAVEHAQTCIIDDKKLQVYYPSSESNEGLVFDVVGGRKGVILGSHYIPYNNLSEAEKEHAHNLLSTFENIKDVISFDDETTLLHKYPYRTSCISDPIVPSSSHVYDPKGPGTSYQQVRTPGNVHGNDLEELGTLYQGILSPVGLYGYPDNRYHFGSLGSATGGQTYDSFLGVLPNESRSSQFSDHDPLSEIFGANNVISQNNFPEAKPPHQQRNAGIFVAVVVMLWKVRVRKRLLAVEGIHVQKRQRT